MTTPLNNSEWSRPNSENTNRKCFRAGDQNDRGELNGTQTEEVSSLLSIVCSPGEGNSPCFVQAAVGITPPTLRGQFGYSCGRNADATGRFEHPDLRLLRRSPAGDGRPESGPGGCHFRARAASDAGGRARHQQYFGGRGHQRASRILVRLQTNRPKIQRMRSTTYLLPTSQETDTDGFASTRSHLLVLLQVPATCKLGLSGVTIKPLTGRGCQDGYTGRDHTSSDS